MTVNVPLDHETARALGALARARGLTLEAFLRSVVEQSLSSENGTLSLPEFERQLDELAADLPPIPPLPPDFSRADIYAGHD